MLGDEFIDDLSNIYTEASGNQINIFHSDMLNLGATTSTGRSGVIKLNGNIYFVSHSYSYMLELNPITETTRLIGDLYSGGSKWAGGVLANKKIYFSGFLV